jgi:hypothetical protein
MTLAALAASQERGVGYVNRSKNALYDGAARPSLDSTGSEARRTDLTNNPGQPGLATAGNHAVDRASVAVV